jgi:ribosomal protein S8
MYFVLVLKTMITQIKNNQNGETYRIDLTQSSHQRQIMSILNFPYMHNMSA